MLDILCGTGFIMDRASAWNVSCVRHSLRDWFYHGQGFSLECRDIVLDILCGTGFIMDRASAWNVETLC